MSEKRSSVMVSFRLDRDELERIQFAAYRSGVSLSQYLRDAALLRINGPTWTIEAMA